MGKGLWRCMVGGVCVVLSAAVYLYAQMYGEEAGQHGDGGATSARDMA